MIKIILALLLMTGSAFADAETASEVLVQQNGTNQGYANTVNCTTGMTCSTSAGTWTLSGGGGSSFWVAGNVGINTTSNVGIGTVNPGQNLEVQGTLRLLNGSLGIGTSSPSITMSINSKAAQFRNEYYAGSGVFDLTNVFKFVYRGWFNGSDNNITVTNYADIDFTEAMRFSVNGTYAMAFLSTGLGVLNTSQYSISSDGNPNGAQDVGYGRQSPGVAKITNGAAGGPGSLYVGGNIGIGSTAPGVSLDVVGTIRSNVWNNTLNGPLLFGSLNKALPVTGSSVKPSTDISAGAIQINGLGIGVAPGSFIGVNRLNLKGAFTAVDLSNNSFLNLASNTGEYALGDLSNFYHGGELTIDGSGLSTLIGTSVELYNNIWGNYLIADSAGGVTMRAYNGAGFYADVSGYSYIGNYDGGGAAVVDLSGNMAVANNNSPTDGAIFQAGPSTGTGGTFELNGENIGGQVFLDVKSASGSSVSTRFINPDFGTFVEIGGCANDGEYFTNCIAGDAIMKGALAGNGIHLGSTSGDALFNVDPSTVWIGSSAAPTSSALNVTGSEYVSGNVSIGTTVSSNKLSVMGGNVSIGTTASTARLSVIGGNVGIGSVTPGTVLDVQGEIRSSDWAAATTGNILCKKASGGIGYCTTLVGVLCTTCS